MTETERTKTLTRLPDGDAHTVRVERAGEAFRIGLGGPEACVTVYRAGSGIWSVLGEDGSSFEALVQRDEDELRVVVGHRVFRFSTSEAPARGASPGAASGKVEVKAPMPGKVVKLLASVGDTVRGGQGVLLFEAMKMQNEIRAPRDGTLTEVAVVEGQAVEARSRLFVLQS